MTKEVAKQQVAKLIEKYQNLVDTRKVKSYNEAQTRTEFIEPKTVKPALRFVLNMKMSG